MQYGEVWESLRMIQLGVTEDDPEEFLTAEID